MRLRNILLIIGLIGLSVVVILNIHQFSSFYHLLSTLRWYVLFLVVIIQLGSYYLNALYYRSILGVFDYRVSTLRLFKGALAANFVNYILPSAGMAGAGIMSQVLSPDVPRGKGVLVQIMRYGLSALAVLVMTPIGLGLVLLGRQGNSSIDGVVLTASLAIVVFAGLIVALVHQEKSIRRLVAWIKRRFGGRLLKFNTLSLDKFIDDFFIGYREMIKERKRMLKPIAWSLVYIVIEILTLYLSFLAFGKWINPGVAITAYVIANISSLVGGTFFSVGVFEVGMVGTLVALGEPFVVAFSVTLVYRMMNLIIGLPPGFIYYHQFLPKAKRNS